MARFDPTQPLEMKTQKPVETADVAPEYNVTTLSNGFTVLTESQTFPGAVHMGKCLFPAVPFLILIINL